MLNLSISGKIRTINKQIVAKKLEIFELEAKLRELQKQCQHAKGTQVESLDGKEGWMTCDECGMTVVRVF